MDNNKKILVLMSGGVDSSVSAALLKEQGYDVMGVYLKLWQETDKETLGDSCWAQEMRDAAGVAAHLSIPFTTWDVTEIYKERVLKDFYSEYAAGRTPNPDVLCNSEVKFGIAYDRAMEFGYDFIATGHYARIVNGNSLYVGKDSNKDQSYFLWKLKQNQLNHILFPIGEYTKPYVRELAQKFGLHNAGKKDSQGVCFLGQIDLQEFLKRSITATPGEIIDVHGNVLGAHENFEQFTVGQREGLKIGGTGPYFVVAKDMARHAIIVAHESEADEYGAKSCTVRNVNWLGDIPASGSILTARPRYRSSLVSISIQVPQSDTDSAPVWVLFRPDQNVGAVDAPHGVSPHHFLTPLLASGQSIVFYEDDPASPAGRRVVGGGVIDTVELLKQPAALAEVGISV